MFGVPAGTTRSVADGYWALIRRLSPGTHTVSFGGALPVGYGNAFMQQSVLVQETAEQVASVDSGWRVAADEGHSSGWIRRLKLQRPVGAMSVVVRDVHLEGPLQVAPPHDQ